MLGRVIVGTGFGLLLVLSVAWIAPWFLDDDGLHLFIDARLYHEAASAWLAGGNPWAVEVYGIAFAAPPPALLLNVPTLPFGPHGATVLWVVANTVSVVYLIWRLALPIWTVMLLPVAEGWLAATPDLTLAALVVAGGGGLATLTKPYSIPALLADGRWRAIALGLGTALVTLPLLPWGQFLDSSDLVTAAFRENTLNVSALGEPVLMLATAGALVLLGRRGLALATPGLLAQQPHYLVFSLPAITSSRTLTLAAMIPLPHAFAFGVLAYAALLVAVAAVSRAESPAGSSISPSQP